MPSPSPLPTPKSSTKMRAWGSTVAGMVWGMAVALSSSAQLLERVEAAAKKSAVDHSWKGILSGLPGLGPAGRLEGQGTEASSSSRSQLSVKMLAPALLTSPLRLPGLLLLLLLLLVLLLLGDPCSN
jgi:hypothetical protein